MAKCTKTVFLAICVVFGCSYVMIYSANGTDRRRDAEPVIIDAADLYAASCSKCHGADGKAATAKGKRVGATDFTSTDWNTDEARGIRIITKGKGEMPSFRGKLTADEIKALFGYVLKFRQ